MSTGLIEGDFVAQITSVAFGVAVRLTVADGLHSIRCEFRNYRSHHTLFAKNKMVNLKQFAVQRDATGNGVHLRVTDSVIYSAAPTLPEVYGQYCKDINDEYAITGGTSVQREDTQHTLPGYVASPEAAANKPHPVFPKLESAVNAQIEQPAVQSVQSVQQVPPQMVSRKRPRFVTTDCIEPATKRIKLEEKTYLSAPPATKPQLESSLPPLPDAAAVAMSELDQLAPSPLAESQLAPSGPQGVTSRPMVLMWMDDQGQLQYSTLNSDDVDLNGNDRRCNDGIATLGDGFGASPLDNLGISGY